MGLMLKTDVHIVVYSELDGEENGQRRHQQTDTLTETAPFPCFVVVVVIDFGVDLVVTTH